VSNVKVVSFASLSYRYRISLAKLGSGSWRPVPATIVSLVAGWARVATFEPLWFTLRRRSIQDIVYYFEELSDFPLQLMVL
jgi:hypothetical protein